MAYGVLIDMAASRELYDAAHAEFSKYPAEAMILHVARPTENGHQIVEVWQSKEDYERWTGTHVGPVMGALAAAGWTLPEPVITEFTPLGIVVPRAEIYV
jgi:hypothetical protein